MGIAALICGIASLVLCWWGVFGFLGILAGIAAIILGSLNKNPEHAGMAKVGLILGLIGAILGFIFCVSCLACYGCAACGACGSTPTYYYY